MMSSQFVKPFDYFKQVVKQLYPQATDLKCDYWNGNVQPIKYYDNRFERSEYPPVVSWRIGDKKFRYVLDPKFKTSYYNDMVSLLANSTTRTTADYKDQEKLVLELIKYTVEGKTAEEINDILKLRRQDVF